VRELGETQVFAELEGVLMVWGNLDIQFLYMIDKRVL
jgi:hypothetical protein